MPRRWTCNNTEGVGNNHGFRAICVYGGWGGREGDRDLERNCRWERQEVRGGFGGEGAFLLHPDPALQYLR